MLLYGPCIYTYTTLKIKVMLQIYFSCVPVHADNLCNLKSPFLKSLDKDSGMPPFNLFSYGCAGLWGEPCG